MACSLVWAVVEELLDAAHELMLTVGLARTTTKEIAKAAECSEAALYKYFSSKEELFIRVLEERLPTLGPLLGRLTAEPGKHTVEENLTEIARQAALFYEQIFPILASLYAETQLKRRHEEAMRAMGAGPHMPIRGLTAYLRAEQRAGRVHLGADTSAAASLLLGACAQRAFAYDMTEDGKPPPLDTFAPSLARTLLRRHLRRPGPLLSGGSAPRAGQAGGLLSHSSTPARSLSRSESGAAEARID